MYIVQAFVSQMQPELIGTQRCHTYREALYRLTDMVGDGVGAYAELFLATGELTHTAVRDGRDVIRIQEFR